MPTFRIREYRRIPVQCPLYFSHDGQYGAGTVWNLSCGGWRVDTEIPLTRGTVLKLFVMLPEVPQGVIVERAIVTWSRGQEVGLAILRIHPQDATRLQHVIAKSL
jgi:hypothetical protein